MGLTMHPKNLKYVRKEMVEEVKSKSASWTPLEFEENPLLERDISLMIGDTEDTFASIFQRILKTGLNKQDPATKLLKSLESQP